MSEAVNRWKQKGRVFIWRYPPHSRKREGWHVTADAEACESLIQLIGAMRSAARSTRRTVALSRPAASVWAVPNFGEPRREKLGPLTMLFDPSFRDLALTEQEDRLQLRFGHARADELLAALDDVRRGKGDYAVAPNEEGSSPPIWFWWMLREIR